MIIVMKPHAAESSIKAITDYIQESGLYAHLSRGTEVTIIGVVGDKNRLSTENLISFKDVDRIQNGSADGGNGGNGGSSDGGEEENPLG